jgi:AcrR family transcriptional regulator
MANRKQSVDLKASTRERILSAAEDLFAEHGYDGTGLRDIALKAQTRIGLVSYHFQSKEKLYELIVESRSSEIGRIRLNLLTKERKKYGANPIPISNIIYAYTWPFLEFAHSEVPGWKSYTKIISNVAHTPRFASLISTYYDAVAVVFLSELRRTLPATPEADLTASFTFMVSVMLGIAADTGRADNLSNGAVRSADIERMFAIMLPFLAAGFATLSAGQSSRTNIASV